MNTARHTSVVLTRAPIALVSLLLTAILLPTASLQADVILHSVKKFDPCEGGLTPGGTWLIDDGDVDYLSLSTAEKQEIYNDITGQFDPAWEYAWGSSLGGDIHVDQYFAVDDDGYDKYGNYLCAHGADIVVHYEDITVPTGKTVDWLQVYTESGQAVQYPDPYKWTVDPPPGITIDGVVQDQAPFYYNQGENATPSRFSDSPRDYHLEALPWSGGVTFYLFLASWDGTYTPGTYPHTVTLHDGIAWGYTGYCVPEPVSCVLFAGSVFGALILRLKRT